MVSIENYKNKLESMSKEELLHEISNLISDHGIQLQDKCNEIQELKSALARADLQLQFQIGEVDLRDNEIESLKGKRKPEDNEVLNILNNFSEVAYKQGCANDILKVVDYINWQKIQIEWLSQVKNVSDDEVEKALEDLDKICCEKSCSDKINLVRNSINSVRRENERLKEQLNKDKVEVEYSPFLMCENYDLYLRSMSKEELIEYFYFVTNNHRNLFDKSTLENIKLEKQVNCLKQEMEEKNTYEEKLNSMIDNLRDDISEQKAEIERLKKRHGVALLRNDDLDLENYELKKQVDTKTEHLEKTLDEIDRLKVAHSKSVKDTAEEIEQELEDKGYFEYGQFTISGNDFIEIFKKRAVEVE